MHQGMLSFFLGTTRVSHRATIQTYSSHIRVKSLVEEDIPQETLGFEIRQYTVEGKLLWFAKQEKPSEKLPVKIVWRIQLILLN